MFLFLQLLYNMEILKQRPALQSLREKHFCQLACQVVPLHNKFYSQNIVIISNFLIVIFFQQQDLVRSQIKMFSSHNTQLSKSKICFFLFLARGPFPRNQISPKFYSQNIVISFNSNFSCNILWITRFGEKPN